MKKFALIFLLFVSCFGLCACAKINSTATLTANSLKQDEIAEKTEFVISFINSNYEEYCFDRFIDFGVKKLVFAATTEELTEIETNLNILDEAIKSSEDLSQKEMETPTGATNAIFQIEKPLYRIWRREMTTKK